MVVQPEEDVRGAKWDTGGIQLTCLPTSQPFANLMSDNTRGWCPAVLGERNVCWGPGQPWKWRGKSLQGGSDGTPRGS